jgi:hypothetical protein
VPEGLLVTDLEEVPQLSLGEALNSLQVGDDLALGDDGGMHIEREGFTLTALPQKWRVFHVETGREVFVPCRQLRAHMKQGDDAFAVLVMIGREALEG